MNESSEKKASKIINQNSSSLKPRPAYLEKILIFLVILGVMGVSFWLSQIDKQVVSSNEAVDQKEVMELDLDNIKASVVNVICPEAGAPFNLETDQNQGGSGFVLNESGRIVTNYHVMTTDEDPYQTIPLHEEGCLVLFPNQATGFSEEVYVAKPVYYERLSYDYDLAFLDIYDVYDEGEVVGNYPKKFQAIELPFCKNEDILLGDGVISLGYPAATDGYTLTLAEGIVSAFTDFESIYSTSSLGAGGSGGPVINQKGCLAGVYAGVVYDDFIYYGEVYTAQSIEDFIRQSESIELKREKERLNSEL